MSSLLQSIFSIIGQIFSADSNVGAGSPPDDSGSDENLDADGGVGCFIPENAEIQSRVPHDNVPGILTTAQAFTFGKSADAAASFDFTAQAVGCVATIRSNLDNVNIRSGPDLSYEPPVASTTGGTTFEIVGVADGQTEDPIPWFALRMGDTAGWVRSDLVNLSTDCADVSFLSEEIINNITSTPGPPPSDVFPSPIPGARINQGYNASTHKGYDLNAKAGTLLKAATTGEIIRRIECKNCTEEKPNRQPIPGRGCPNLYGDIDWGFGYGNFIVVRHDYSQVPPKVRQAMDANNLKDGFVYVLYAHMTKLEVSLSQKVRAGTVLGTTGNTGCSSGDHLHFEVRIGNVPTVDNRWSLQKPLNPNLMFDL